MIQNELEGNKMIAIACDHGAVALKKEIEQMLDEMGLAYQDFGTDSSASVDYPVYAEKAARAVTSGECDRGILLCGTGLGMSLAANKVRGIRCALCGDCFSAEMSRRHNNANMLALGARVIGPELAKMITRIFLTTEFEGGRHARRVGMIDTLDQGGTLNE